jgi:hypothetical protein
VKTTTFDEKRLAVYWENSILPYFSEATSVLKGVGHAFFLNIQSWADAGRVL